MPFVLLIDRTNDVLKVEIHGALTEELLFAAYEKTKAYVDSHPPCDSILDFSHLTSVDISTDSLRKLATMPPAMYQGFVRVNVAPGDAIYGMARMFQMLSESNRPEIRVVRTLAEAYKLIGLESPHFEKLEQASAAASNIAV